MDLKELLNEEDYFDDDEPIASNDPNFRKPDLEERQAQLAKALRESLRQRAQQESGFVQQSPNHRLSNESTSKDEDPLEKYMMEINQTLEIEKARGCSVTQQSKSFEKPEICEEEDDGQISFWEYLTKKEDAEEAAQNQDEENVNLKKNAVLPAVNHAEIDYDPFIKDIYIEADSIKNMSKDDRALFRASRKIKVTGYKVTQAIKAYDDLKQTLLETLLLNVRSQGWETPTSIQSQLIPVALNGRDIVAVAETGSGKTAAYCIPLIQHVCKNLDFRKLRRMSPGRGPMGLIICPTRELALQIYDTCKKLAANLNVRLSFFGGGYDKTAQFKEISSGLEICVGTPGRLIDLGTMKNGVRFQDVTFLVLDEVDTLLSHGFEKAVLSLSAGMRPDKQVLLLSATVSPGVERVILSISANPVKISVGSDGQVSSFIEQKAIVFPDEKQKADWIVNNIAGLIDSGSQLIVFCKSHGRTVDLSAILNDVLEQSRPKPNVQSYGNSTGSGGNVYSSAQLTKVGNVTMVPGKYSSGLSSWTARNQMTPALARLSGGSVPTVENENTVSEIPVASGAQPVGRLSHREIFSKCLFGDMSQAERTSVLTGFRKRKFPILVASDVASRGLDIQNVSAVINYDMACTYETHIHRIGRTGRGAPGTAYSLLTPQDAKASTFVVESMEKLGKTAPRSVVDLALTYEPYCAAKKAGRSYFPQSRPKGEKRKSIPRYQYSSMGLGYDELSPTSRSMADSFVSENAKPLRRWDVVTSQGSRNNNSKNKGLYDPGQKYYVEDPNSAPKENFESAKAQHPKKHLKIFSPTDEISSDSSTGEEEVVEIEPKRPSLLKPKVFSNESDNSSTLLALATATAVHLASKRDSQSLAVHQENPASPNVKLPAPRVKRTRWE